MLTVMTIQSRHTNSNDYTHQKSSVLNKKANNYLRYFKNNFISKFQEISNVNLYFASRKASKLNMYYIRFYYVSKKYRIDSATGLADKWKIKTLLQLFFKLSMQMLSKKLLT